MEGQVSDNLGGIQQREGEESSADHLPRDSTSPDFKALATEVQRNAADQQVLTETDAEQWLTRRRSISSEVDTDKQPALQTDENKENKVETSELTKAKDDKDADDPVQEVDAEKWLTRFETRDALLLQWKEDGELKGEARSSVSSPGKTSLREKLQHRLQKRQEERRKYQHSDQLNLSADALSSHLVNDSMEDILGTFSNSTSPPTSPLSDTGLSTPVDTHAKRRNAESSGNNVVLHRLSRTVRYGRRGVLPLSKDHYNVIRLHIYDLLPNDTIMKFPFGLELPIGRCFQAMNNGLQALGTGAYHCGVEVNGIEYGYGANDIGGCTGVFTCVPKHSPGYQYRTTIDLGRRCVRKTSWVNIQTDLVDSKTGDKKKTVSNIYKEIDNYLDGHEVLRDMATEYRGTDYDLLRKNCCTFARDACLRLGVKEHEIPSWFMNLAEVGAATQDAAEKTISAITKPNCIMTVPLPKLPQIPDEQQIQVGGYEVVAHGDSIEFVKVIDTVEDSEVSHVEKPFGVRRTLSWTY